MANELGTLVSQFQNVKATNVDYQLVFVRRQVNRVVHSLLKTSILYPRTCDFVPLCITPSIIEEMI